MAATTGYPTAEKYLETRRHAEAGLQADPDNARLLGLLASVLTGDVLNNWNGAGEPEVARAKVAAEKALSLDRNTPLAHYALGYVHRLHGDHKAALDSFKKAVSIDPNFAKALAQAANEMVFTGNAKGAIAVAEAAAQLSPRDPSIGVFLWVKGRAYFTLGDYPNAIEALKESVRVRPNLWYTQAWLAAAYALTDNVTEAKKVLKGSAQTFSPTTFNRAWITRYYAAEQYQNPTLEAASDKLLKGLEKAGLK